MERQQVDSSNISEIGFDAQFLTLEVLFTDGRVYQYFDVPVDVFAELIAAGSIGKFFNSNIRGVYRYARV
ncbi:KTSC domain-containing protein [Lysobacter sp. 22409]|uniref:KTSC domain-containing protein n=1 Tax=Lysobacter sp. 22409 TaxID=3453917 RepID=UPI003F8622B5